MSLDDRVRPVLPTLITGGDWKFQAFSAYSRQPNQLETDDTESRAERRAAPSRPEMAFLQQGSAAKGPKVGARSPSYFVCVCACVCVCVCVCVPAACQVVWRVVTLLRQLPMIRGNIRS